MPLWANWGAGNGHTAFPQTFAAQLPLGLLGPARLSQERLFTLTCGLSGARVNCRLCLLESPHVKLCFVLASRSVGTLSAPNHSGESPSEAKMPRGKRDREMRTTESRGGIFFPPFLLRDALLDQKLKAANIFLSRMPPSCWPAKLVS